MAKTGRGGRRNQKLNRAAANANSTQPPIAKTLPEDLINEILFRTPVKSLVRFRCVSKSWLLRTLHPKFISMHVARNALNNKQLMCRTCDFDLVNKTSSNLIAYFSYMEQTVLVHYLHDCKTTKSDCKTTKKLIGNARTISFSDFSKDMVLAGSINGIICLSQQNIEMRGRFVALWNPAINRWKLVRVPGLKSDCDRLYALTVGLGFDEAADDYKIVRIVPVVREPDFQEHCWSRVEIYSANSHSWTEVVDKDDGFVPFWPKLPNCNFIIKGCPYWVGVDRPDDMMPYEPMQKHEFLAVVDPCTGSFRKVSYPEYVKNESTHVHPLKWKDSLAILIQSPGEHPNPIVDMYWMDEKNKIWTKVHTIRPYDYFEGECGFRIPQSLTTGEIVIETWKGMCLIFKCKPYFWDPNSDTMIYTSEFDTLRPLWYESYSHVESLVCVKGMELIGMEDKNKKKTKPAKNWTEMLSKDFESLLHIN